MLIGDYVLRSAARALVAATIILVPQMAAAQAASPAAIVEDASADAPVVAFDYLRQGEAFDLAQNAVVVIGYLASCRLERITGGSVLIGESRSTITGGRVTIETVDCDGGQIEMTREAAAAGGVTVHRSGPRDGIRVYSTTPVVLAGDVSPGNALEIRRLDREEPVRRLAMEQTRADLQALGLPVTPGGHYEARLGDRSTVFHVVVYARRGGPLVGRLVRF